MEKIKELNIVNQENYYTPTIDEFHIGFEYEMILPIGFSIIDFSNPKEEWKTQWSTKFEKGIFGVSDADPWGGVIAGIKAAIKDNKCRVKYLDQEDIESLGWTFKSPYNFNIKNWELSIDPEDYEIDIHYNMETNRSIHFFTGIIKNKSELKRLMKQLNIK